MINLFIDENDKSCLDLRPPISSSLSPAEAEMNSNEMWDQSEPDCLFNLLILSQTEC